MSKIVSESETDKLPTNRDLLRGAVLSAIIVILVAAVLAYKDGFSLFKAVVFSFVWCASMWLVISRRNKARKEGLHLDKPSTTLEDYQNSLKMAGGIKGLLRWATLVTIFLLAVIFIKVWLEHQI